MFLLFTRERFYFLCFALFFIFIFMPVMLSSYERGALFPNNDYDIKDYQFIQEFENKNFHNKDKLFNSKFTASYSRFGGILDITINYYLNNENKIIKEYFSKCLKVIPCADMSSSASYYLKGSVLKFDNIDNTLLYNSIGEVIFLDNNELTVHYFKRGEFKSLKFQKI